MRPSTTPSRCSWSSSWPWPRRGPYLAGGRRPQARRRIGGGTPAAWWLDHSDAGPLLGHSSPNPAAMTISAVLLGRRSTICQPQSALKYATLGLLFVNVSIGGTLTPFAAPPVLMVARPWEWDLPFMLDAFRLAGGRVHRPVERGLLPGVSARACRPGQSARRCRVDQPDDDATERRCCPCRHGCRRPHCLHGVDRVLNSHHPALFIGGFLFFLGFARATSGYQHRLELRTPLLVGFFLAGLVIHGGLQAWWIRRSWRD